MKLKHSYFDIQESNVWSYLNLTNHFSSQRDTTKLNVAFSPCSFAQFHGGPFFAEDWFKLVIALEYKTILVENCAEIVFLYLCITKFIGNFSIFTNIWIVNSLRLTPVEYLRLIDLLSTVHQEMRNVFLSKFMYN